MSRASAWLATLATCVGTVLVFLLYLPALQAPFLVPKFGALEISASLGLVAFALHRMATGRPRWRRSMAAAAWLVLATTVIGAALNKSEGPARLSSPPREASRASAGSRLSIPILPRTGRRAKSDP